eukprot:5747103-Amphidinium_carterae.1
MQSGIGIRGSTFSLILLQAGIHAFTPTSRRDKDRSSAHPMQCTFHTTMTTPRLMSTFMNKENRSQRRCHTDTRHASPFSAPDVNQKTSQVRIKFCSGGTA